MPILLSSSTPNNTRDDWNTPPWLLELIRTFKPIEFDPCSNAGSFVGAPYWCDGSSERENGLDQDWFFRDLIFVNPPYSNGLYPKFCAKMHEEALRGAEIIALVPANVETRAWQDHLWRADAWCFPKRRINFYYQGQEKKGVNFASCLVYFGPDSARFAKVFEALGHVIHHGDCI